MSQDNQNSQPPSPEPQENQPKQRRDQKALPFWKAKIIQFLKGAIALLETTVEKLETEPPAGVEESPNFLQPLQSAWSGLLTKIRSLLPANLSAKFSDTALTGVITLITVILIWTTSNLLTAKPTEIATTPPTPSTQTTPEIIPSEEPTPLPTEEPQPPVVEEPAPTPSIAETTPPPEPAPEVTPTPTPTPTFVLTPEQTLIAAIENQVAEVSDRFASGLIQSIQANFLTSTLTMKISDEWYALKESQQNKLAAEILQRSQELDFTHLEVTDSQNRLVARNPVVGNEMIIFRRR